MLFRSQIQEICGRVILENTINELLPSSHLNHYQLDGNAFLVYSEENEKMTQKIIDLSNNYQHATILCCAENAHLYKMQNRHIQNVMVIASKNNLTEYSKNLFSCLRKASSLSSDILLLEGVKKENLGIAIMNRLLHVCNGNYIEI